MRNFKKILFTLFLIITSITTISAKETILTCNYYKPYDQLGGSREAGVLCNIYSDYSHMCYINVDSDTGTTSGNKEKIQNWGYAIGLSWQAKEYVKENNKCPDYLLLKLDDGINGYEIHAAATKEDLSALQSSLSGQRYFATLKGNVSDEDKQKKIKEVQEYIDVIHNFINSYSLNNCANNDKGISKYDNCDKLISSYYTNIHTWEHNVNNWLNEGYFDENNETYKNFQIGLYEFDDFYKNARKELDENIQKVMDNDNDNDKKENDKSNADLSKFCQEKSVLKSLRFIGYILLIVKIIIPLLLIILGTVDFSKAIVSSDSDAIQKSTKSLVTRVIAGIIIFLLPTIVNFAFSLVQKGDTSSFNNCRVCIFNPNRCPVND